MAQAHLVLRIHLDSRPLSASTSLTSSHFLQPVSTSIRTPQVKPESIPSTSALRVRCRICRTTLKQRQKESSHLKVSKILECFKQDSPKVSKILEKLGPPLELADWFILLEEIGNRQRWLLALEVFRWMQQQSWKHMIDAGFYAKLIAIMGKQRQLRLAVWLFSEMRRNGLRPDTSVFNAIINAHLRNRQVGKALEKALYYLDEMKRRANCRPNVVTYNILLRACAQSGLFDEVEGFFGEMEKEKLSPDIYTYNGIIDAYGKAGHIAQMESSLEKMRKQHIKPDLVTFNTLIDTYGKRKEFVKMERVFASLRKSKHTPNQKTFNSMIGNYGRAALLQKMHSTVKCMAATNCQPNLATYEAQIISYGLCKEFQMMAEVCNQMIMAGICPLPSTLNAILEVYCGCGLLNEAEDWLRNARHKIGVEATASSYTILVRAYGRAGQLDKMQHLIERMEALGLQPNKRSSLHGLQSYPKVESSTTIRN